MHRIIPFIILIATVFYLFYSPAPMDKIDKIVKTRDCYHLRLIDEERLSLSSDKTTSIDATPPINKNNCSENGFFDEEQKQDNFSLALSQQAY